PFLAAGTRILPNIEKEISFDETTPMVNLSYRFTDEVMVYATYSEGFKSGGFTQRVFPPIVAPFTAPPGTPDIDLIPTYDPEFVEVYEIGAKFASLDNRMTLNGAIFYTDYDDIQVQVFTSVAPVTRNAGTATIKGFELEGQFIPGEGWLMDFGVGYVDAGFDDIDEGTTFLSTDSEFERVPKWTLSASASKEFNLPGGSLLLPRLDWSYRSKTYNDSFNTPEIAQDAYSLVNTSLAWQSASESQRLTLGVANLTDEDYLITGISGDAFQAYEGIYARGREWYVTYDYRF
ncbi:MAG: TonB-dependent receptor, partial [Pseudomonadota bacterium]